MQMQLLQERIRKDGQIREGNILKVDSFLNHQIDVSLLQEIGKELKRQFEGKEITKILTIEASGIAIACIAAQYFGCPVIFAKKTKTLNIIVSKSVLHAEDKVLIIDDFLANGKAIFGLSELIRQAGAELVGAGVVIEKGFQEGGKRLREMGIDLHSLAIVESMDPAAGSITFRKED